MPRVTVIIPTFNRKAYLKQALASVHAQTRPVDEIIVWDDGSTDGTHEMFAGMNDPKLRYHRAENAGKSAALNQAMQLATGDYIWICDDDDLVLPDAAERLTAVLDMDASVGVSGGSYQRFRDTRSGRDLSGPGYWPDLSSGTPMRHLLEDIFLFQNAMIVRRSCYDKVGPFREDLARSIDYDMIIRLATRFPVRMIQEEVFLQRKHDGDRGPVGARHAASAVNEVWAAQDKVVFEGLTEHIPHTLMEALFDGPEAEIRRAARLQRACIFARHGLWSIALDDLEAASTLAPMTPLGSVERQICRRAVSGKHGVVLTAQDSDRMVRLKRSGKIGRDIAGSLGRGLLWRLRNALSGKDWAEAKRLTKILRTTGIKTGSARAGSEVEEYRTLPLSAYEW